MLKVEPDQIDRLQTVQLSVFEREMYAHVGEAFPETLDADPALETEIPRLLEKGRAFGLRSKFDLRRYLELVYETGGEPSGNHVPWAYALLVDPNMHPMEKMDRIDRAMMFDMREPTQ